MKKILRLIACLGALCLLPVKAQQPAAPADLTKFNLDFSGGPPIQLVQAIEHATGKPLNAIITEEDAQTPLPALKMNNINVAELFQALDAASAKAVSVKSANDNQFHTIIMHCGFSRGNPDADNPAVFGLQPPAGGAPTDDSIWYFHADKPVEPAVGKICRFFTLAPYLSRGFSVDDITTAIQTGWKMTGDVMPPDLNYHKETKLLIAFGQPSQLQVIDDVLRTLPQSNATLAELESLRDQVQDLQNKISVLQTQMKRVDTKLESRNAEQDKSGK